MSTPPARPPRPCPHAAALAYAAAASALRRSARAQRATQARRLQQACRAGVRTRAHRLALVGVLALALPASAQVGAPLGSQLDHPTEHGRQAQGEGLAYEIEMAAEYSDNRGRAARNGEDDLLLAPRLDFDMYRVGSRFQARADGNLEYLASLGNVYDDELRARFGAQLDWAIWPERIYWTVQDYAGVEPVSTFESASPDNLQQTNVFITGPSLRISPRGAWYGEVDARFTDSHAEETRSFNSERVTGAVRVGHRFDSARSLELALETTDVDYDEGLRIIGGDPQEAPAAEQPLGDPDHERHDAWLRYRSTFPRLVADLSAGRSRIRFADGGELDGPLLRAFASWIPNEMHRASVQVVREYSDAVRDLVSQIGALDPDLDLEGRPEIGPAIFLLRALELGYERTFARSALEVRPYVREYDYQRDADFLDQRSRGVRADYTYLVDPRTTLRAAVGAERRSFDRVAREDDNLYAGLFVERRLSRQWAVRAGVTRYQRDSTSLGSDYEENVVSVAVVWFGGR